MRLLSAALPKGSGLAPTLVTQREGENFGQPWDPWLRKGWKARGQRGEVREKVGRREARRLRRRAEVQKERVGREMNRKKER